MNFNNPVTIKRKKRIHNQHNFFPISSLVDFCNSKVICLNYTCVQLLLLLLLLLVRKDWWWVVEFTHPTHMKPKFSRNFFQTHAARIKLRKRSQRDDARRIWRMKKLQRQREYSARTWSKKIFATRCSSKDFKEEIFAKRCSSKDLEEKIFTKRWSRANFCRLCSRYYTLHCQDLEQSRAARAMLAYFPLCCPDPPWPTCKTHHQFKQTDRKTDRHRRTRTRRRRRRTRTRRLAWYIFADRQKLLCKFCSSWGAFSHLLPVVALLSSDARIPLPGWEMKAAVCLSSSA